MSGSSMTQPSFDIELKKMFRSNFKNNVLVLLWLAHRDLASHVYPFIAEYQEKRL